MCSDCMHWETRRHEANSWASALATSGASGRIVVQAHACTDGSHIAVAMAPCVGGRPTCLHDVV